MKEIEIIKVFLEERKENESLKLYCRIWNEEIEKENYKKKKIDSDNLILELHNKLQNLSRNDYSNSLKLSIIDQLNAYLSELNANNLDLEISKNQSTVLVNKSFGLIISDINNIITDKTSMIRIPFKRLYTSDENNTIKKIDVINFFEKEIEILKTIKDPNYIKIDNYYNDLQHRIKKVLFN